MRSFKNYWKLHSWQYTGVVEETEWPRSEVKCTICGERRLIAVSISSPGFRRGCYRTAFRDRLKPGDMLLITDGRRDRFEAYVPDGSGVIITSNLGGGSYKVEAGQWERQT